MVDQLLWIDALIKFASGATLVVLPQLLIAALGLPRTDQLFYPRLIGAFLIGTALALVIEGAGDASSGLSLLGAVAINLCVASFLVLLLLFARPASTRRGRLTLWTFLLVLIALSLMQGVYA